MKMQVFSVFDSKTKVFSQPNFLVNKGAALRAWMDACNDPQSNISKHPEDFTFFHIGEYDDENGTFENLKTPESLGCAIQFVRNEAINQFRGATMAQKENEQCNQ